MRSHLSMAALIVLLGLALAVLVGLGVWQLQRNQWKQDLVAEWDARTDAPAIVVRDAAGLDPDAMDYRHVTVEGEWLVEDVMFLANRIRAASRGEEILVPVQPADGGPVVLANLGWIPEGARADVVPGLLASPGPVEGLARDIRGRTAQQTPSESWTGVDGEAMGAALSLSVADWYVVVGSERAGDASVGDSLPVQGWQRFTNTTPHIEYALTWFGIAIALVVISVVRLIIAPRRARQRAQQGTSGSEAVPSAGAPRTTPRNDQEVR